MQTLYKTIFLLLLVTTISFAAGQARSTYTVVKLAQPVEINAVWDKAPWNDIEELTMPNYMGSKPSHFPAVFAKVAYDDEAMYVIFKVEDKYVIATAEKYLGRVWEDSCVEFFFTPDEDSRKGYFNFEMNCGGTVYFQYQDSPGKNTVQIAKSDFDKITIAHTMSKIINPEIKTATTWYVEYRMPISILEKYFKITKPAPGLKWRANFNKCADQCSHPHWLTWSKVDHPTPAFHKPQYFGVLEFADVLAVDSSETLNPASFQLEQNYPNPFNPKTTIRYSVAAPSTVTLRVFNTNGALVNTLVNGFHNSGEYTTQFDGSGLPSGIYLYQLTNGADVKMQRMLLIK